MSNDLNVNNSSAGNSSSSAIPYMMENIHGLISKLDCIASSALPVFDQNFTKLQFTVSIASCLIFLFLLTVTIWRKKDIMKTKSSLRLNEAVVQLESTIKNISFENQTFMGKLIEFEKEVEDVRRENVACNEKLIEIEETSKKNEEKHRDHLQTVTKDYIMVESKCNELIEKEKLMEAELKVLREERKMIEISLNSYKENEKHFIEKEKYEELEFRFNELEGENELNNDELIKLKVDSESYVKQVENLQNEIDLRNKSLLLLENFVSKITTSGSSLATIHEEETEAVNVGNLEKFMNIANLQMKIHDLEQQLQNKAQQLESLKTEQSKCELELKDKRKDFGDMKCQYDESLARVKRLETEIRVSEELRVKDIERNLKREGELEAQLRKKTSDAERATHLLEQLRLKQERIQELEGQIERIERNATSDRSCYDKQMNDMRVMARRYEKECEEAKKEAESVRKECKIWREKYDVAEKYKEKLIRPVAAYKMSPYIQPPIIDPNDNQLNQSDESPNDISPTESSVEQDRPSSATGFLSPMYHRVTSSQHAISPTPVAHPIFIRGLTPPIYHPMYPPPTVPYLPVRMPAVSPDVMSQYMNQV